jgi:hypothetical protein
VNGCSGNHPGRGITFAAFMPSPARPRRPEKSMTRTAWAVTVALLIAAGSLALAGTRRYVLGDDIDGPRGRSAWKIGLVAVGRFDERDGSLTVRFPPDFRRQHLVDTESHAIGVVPRNTRGSQTEAVWEPEALAPGKPQRFRLSYSFRCILGSSACVGPRRP